MKLITTDPAKKKKVLCGEMIGNTLFRWVKPEHFMRKFHAYGIQEVAFQTMLKHDIKLIVLKEEGGGNWEATTDTWLKNGRVMDFGHGKQRFLSMKYMKLHKLPEIDQKKEAERDKTFNDIQRKLF